MISRRPVLSPGRIEKYPPAPPLMGFLRSVSNGGSISGSKSRSRRRSRASPLFVRRNKSTVTQEPSSPKVTCMGQVRVGRSKPKSTEIKPKTHENPTRRRRRRCEWLRNAAFYRSFAGKIKAWSISDVWSKWVSIRVPFSRRKSKSKKDSPRNESNHCVEESIEEIEGDKVEEEKEEEECFRNPNLLLPSASASTPPRNALLLIRSRSAPYRSSSLAFRFWEEDNRREIESRAGGDEIGEQNVRSGKLESEIFSGFMGKIDWESPERKEEGLGRRPELKRSKSEPAMIGEKTGKEWVVNEEDEDWGLGTSRD